MTSLNPTLVPDCGVSCIAVYGRWWRNTLKPTYLHRLISDEEMPPQYERTHFREEVNSWLFPQWLTGLKISWSNEDSRTDFCWWGCNHTSPNENQGRNSVLINPQLTPVWDSVTYWPFPPFFGSLAISRNRSITALPSFIAPHSLTLSSTCVVLCSSPSIFILAAGNQQRGHWGRNPPLFYLRTTYWKTNG